MTTDPRAGWYPDPAGRSDTYRWWDGQAWTDATSEVPNAPAPDVGSTAAPRHSTARRVVALVLVAALFASAGVGVGLWLWRDADSPPRDSGAGRPSTGSSPSTSPGTPGGQLDQRTRTATLGAATMTLPGDPYQLHDNPIAVPGLLRVAFLADADVHVDYQGWHDWSAMVALAEVDPVLVGTSDLGPGAEATLKRVARVLYGDHTTTVTDLSIDDNSVDGHTGKLVTAKVHYSVKGLPSRYDTLTAHLVKLEDGTVVAAISSVPDDADRAVVDEAAAALATLSVS